VAQLGCKIGQQALEIDFLRGACSASTSSGSCRPDWKAAVYQQIQNQKDGGQGLTVEHMCELAKVSRAGFYRFVPRPVGPDPDLELRDALQHVAPEFPSYGWPRMMADLQGRGWAVSHKRVYRLMRGDNLLCLRNRKFVVTTNSDHGLPLYPGLVPTLKLTGLDQL
jgi:hypothetical protein